MPTEPTETTEKDLLKTKIKTLLEFDSLSSDMNLLIDSLVKTQLSHWITGLGDDLEAKRALGKFLSRVNGFFCDDPGTSVAQRSVDARETVNNILTSNLLSPETKPIFLALLLSTTMPYDFAQTVARYTVIDADHLRWLAHGNDVNYIVRHNTLYNLRMNLCGDRSSLLPIPLLRQLVDNIEAHNNADFWLSDVPPLLHKNPSQDEALLKLLLAPECAKIKSVNCCHFLLTVCPDIDKTLFSTILTWEEEHLDNFYFLMSELEPEVWLKPNFASNLVTNYVEKLEGFRRNIELGDAIKGKVSAALINEMKNKNILPQDKNSQNSNNVSRASTTTPNTSSYHHPSSLSIIAGITLSLLSLPFMVTRQIVKMIAKILYPSFIEGLNFSSKLLGPSVVAGTIAGSFIFPGIGTGMGAIWGIAFASVVGFALGAIHGIAKGLFAQLMGYTTFNEQKNDWSNEKLIKQQSNQTIKAKLPMSNFAAERYFAKQFMKNQRGSLWRQLTVGLFKRFVSRVKLEPNYRATSISAPVNSQTFKFPILLMRSVSQTQPPRAFILPRQR